MIPLVPVVQVVLVGHLSQEDQAQRLGYQVLQGHLSSPCPLLVQMVQTALWIDRHIIF